MAGCEINRTTKCIALCEAWIQRIFWHPLKDLSLAAHISVEWWWWIARVWTWQGFGLITLCTHKGKRASGPKISKNRRRWVWSHGMSEYLWFGRSQHAWLVKKEWREVMMFLESSWHARGQELTGGTRRVPSGLLEGDAKPFSCFECFGRSFEMFPSYRAN